MADNDKVARERSIVWLLLALAYAVAFAQRVSPQTLVSVLRDEFSAGAADIGLLASGYFYGYMLMQVPAGILVDVLGVRRVMLLSLSVSAAGTALFAAAPGLGFAFMARLLVACSDAIVFAALLKYVAQNFTDRRFGLMSGLSQLSGYLGGIVATLPLAAAVTAWGWRPSFWGLAAVIAGNAALMFLLAPGAAGGPGRALGDLQRGVRAAALRMLGSLKTRESWGSALCFASYFIPAMSLSSVWGFAILMNGFGVSRAEAAIVMSLVLAATMVGSVGGGALADRLQGRLVESLVACCALRTLCLLPLAPALGLRGGVSLVEAALVVFGLVGGATLPMVFRTLKQIYTPEHIGIGTAINSSIAGIGAAVLQPVIGSIIDLAQRPGAGGWSAHGGHDLLAAVLVLSSLAGLAAPFWIRRPVPRPYAASSL